MSVILHTVDITLLCTGLGLTCSAVFFMMEQIDALTKCATDQAFFLIYWTIQGNAVICYG